MFWVGWQHALVLQIYFFRAGDATFGTYIGVKLTRLMSIKHEFRQLNLHFRHIRRIMKNTTDLNLPHIAYKEKYDFPENVILTLLRSTELRKCYFCTTLTC